MSPKVTIDKNRIEQLCRRYHVRKLALFGSVLREDFAQNSDVDILVEFKDGYVPGLAFFTMQNELSQIIGRKVDLNTPQFISRYFRDQVLKEAQVFYDAA